MYTNGLKDRFGSPLISQREINATLGNYILKSDLSTSLNDYALKSDLDGYAKTSSLGSYVLKTELTDTLGDYVTKTTYDSFVSTTNTELGKRGSLASANTWSATNTFSGDLNKTSSTSSPTDNSILNKGENDDLYAPISVASDVETLEGSISAVSTVITSHSGDSSIHVTATDKENLNALVAEKDNFVNKNDDATLSKTLTVTGVATFDSTITKSTNTSNPTATSVLNKGETDSLYAPKSISDTVETLGTKLTATSTVIASHQTDTSLHVSSSEKEGLTSLISNKDNFANKTEDTTFAKSVTVTGGATFDSTITKSNNTTSPTNTTVLNKGENDDLYAPKSHVSDTSIHTSAADKEALAELVNAAPQFAKKTEDNTFTETNTFSKAVTAQNGITASGGDVVISEGVLTFEDLIDGTVVERSGASGYQYVEGMPTSFENGVCYDIGEISDTTDLTNVKFTGEGRLVQTCELWFNTPATVPTDYTWPANIYWIDSATGAAPTLIASKNYRLVFRQEPNKIIASIAYLY